MRPILITSLVLALTTPAFAQAPMVPSTAQAAQRERMTSCNASAGSQKLAGGSRKTFMADCLAGKTAATPAADKPMTAQQMKMKTCNVDASGKGLKGKERRTFMSTCLKG